MLNRRKFILGTAAPLGLMSLGQAAQEPEKEDGDGRYGVSRLSKTVVDRIAGMSLQELKDFHRRELDRDYLGYWKDHGIDWQNGGVMPYRELMKGMPYLAKHYYLKQMYFQGRALWVFSYLFNHFGHDERHLAIARHTKDFIYKYARNPDNSWASELTPEGKVLLAASDPDGQMPGIFLLSPDAGAEPGMRGK